MTFPTTTGTSTRSDPAGAPWRRSWLYCARGEAPTLTWIALLHVLAMAGLAVLPLPTLGPLVVAFAFAFLGGIGTTIAYHRALAHRAVSLHPLVEHVLVLCAVVNGSDDPVNWVAMHRLHHATSDREDDISSPHHGGFWWAHLRWLWQADVGRAAGMAPDLKRHRCWRHAQIPLLALSLFGGLLWPGASSADTLAAAFWLGPIRLLYALHVQCTVNSICHLGALGDRDGSSRNVWWLALAHMGHGENWHGNHHRRPRDARIGRHWWEVDLGWIVIRLLVSVGLARFRMAPRSSATPLRVASPLA